MQITQTMQKFILHWGEMGAAWGINRTVAQIHALLSLCPMPLHAEQISELLKVARSNVSYSLGELRNWGLVRTVHVLGDRRDHFACDGEVWEMFRIILDHRKKREVDPTLEVLRQCRDEMEQSPAEEEYTRERILEFMSFFETMDLWYDKVRAMPMEKMIGLAELPGKLLKPFIRSR